MSRFHSYLQSALSMLSAYDGSLPFAVFLKKQFSLQHKYGSKDRKQIAHLCYCFFRLGNSFEKVKAEERILMALFLCSSSHTQVLEQLKPAWNEKVVLRLEEKLKLMDVPFDYKQVFPFVEELSDGVEAELFCLSHFTQPDLFLRVRPGMKETVLSKLHNAAIDYELKNDDCIVLANAVNIDEVLQLNKEAVVQDWSSQRVGDFLQLSTVSHQPSSIKVWDCCAASGGKSIMAKDVLGEIDLTVSDLRESILANLKKRFAKAGIKNYKSFICDLSKNSLPGTNETFDLILADVPCSGSGTWGRTPEQLIYFNPEQIDVYANLQRKITSNVFPSLKKGGYLLYSTCSVYQKENEKIVSFLVQKFQCKVMEQKLIKGYGQKADTMFAALLQRNA